MADDSLNSISLKLSFRSYLLCLGNSLFLIGTAVVLFLSPPPWLLTFAVLAFVYIGTQIASFLFFGRRWHRSNDELFVPTLWRPQRRLAIPGDGIGIQKLGWGMIMIYLGDPWSRSTPRVAPNLCMSATDMQIWLPHYAVPSTRRKPPGL